MASRERRRALAAEERVRALEFALTPSGETKAEFIGEFSIELPRNTTITLSWVTIKTIMKAIRAYADSVVEKGLTK